MIIIIIILSLSDLGVSNNLIGSLSFTHYGENNAWSKQNTMVGVNSPFATISEVEILKIQEDAVPENTKKATKSIEITEWVYTKTIIILFNLGEQRQNIYLAASRLFKYSAAIHLDFKEYLLTILPFES